MPSLTQEQRSRLGGLAKAGDRNGYYRALEEYGFAYGSLAGGVVRNDTVAGKMANAFMIEQAARMGVTITDKMARDKLETPVLREEYN